jgi:hypothetical protein
MNTQENANATQEQVTVEQAAPVKAKGNKNRNPGKAKNPATAKVSIGYVTPNAMPAAGASLFAHTAVALDALGLMNGATVPGAKLRQIIGVTAVKWHAGKGSFEQTAEGFKLTESGKAKFSARAIDPEYRAAWENVLIHGRTDDRVVKNPACIKPIA